MTTTNNEYKYKIEKGIKLPEVKHGYRSYKQKYPYRIMLVGDSFLVPYTNPESKRIPHYISHMGHKMKGRKFTTRKTAAGVRVWRIE